MKPWRAERGSKLAKLRIEGHNLLFFRIVTHGKKDAYKWLANELNMQLNECHFSCMNEKQCEAAIKILTRD